MGRIREPALQALADTWSPVVLEALDDLGKRVWPPIRERRGLFARGQTIARHSLEGPMQRGDEIVWAVSHTSRPSVFDDGGNLTEGERQFWLVSLRAGSPPVFRIEGAEVVDDIPADKKALKNGFRQAHKQAPKTETFYGNKGPLSHR